MRAKEIRENEVLIGWVARCGSVNGVWNDFTPWGFRIQRYDGSKPMMPLRDRFEPKIYKTRGAAIRALKANG